MLEFHATITINAAPQTIWAILTDATSYPEWDPYCDRIEGTIAEGQKIKAFTSLAPGRAFPVKVGDFKPNAGMTWSGGMPFGLFKGVRSFSLTPKGSATEFTVRETFTGPLLGLFRKSLPDMTEPFQKFAEGLKARAEART